VLRLLTDECLDGRLTRGLAQHYPEIDCRRVQDTAAFQKDDAEVLEFAARENRILVTHDLATIPVHAMERVALSLPMPGVIAVSSSETIATMLSEIALVATCMEPAEMHERVLYLPQR
jgi:hypothetical protein